MRKELKDTLGMLVLVLPVFAVMVFGWMHSPMYINLRAAYDRQKGEHYAIAKTFGSSLNSSNFTIPLDYVEKEDLTQYNRFLGGVK